MRKQDLLERTEELLRQKQVLLQEMEHRVANSLSIIASILMLKARAVTSEETRQHLQRGPSAGDVGGRGAAPPPCVRAASSGSMSGPI